MKKEFIREIDTAMNGYQAFNLVLVKDYDLIICDLNMPVMDGFEFCVKAIKHFSDQNKFFDSKNECKISNYKPYLIACSAMVD